jgi:hypothetical protein
LVENVTTECDLIAEFVGKVHAAGGLAVLTHDFHLNYAGCSPHPAQLAAVTEVDESFGKLYELVKRFIIHKGYGKKLLMGAVAVTSVWNCYVEA